MTFDVAVTGDTIINRRISVIDDDRFRSLVSHIRDADVAHAHLETVIHDFDGQEVYPAAEAGGTWMHSPPSLTEELQWAGFDLVSLAGNHALDYSYGGLKSTIDHLDAAGLPNAGTGTTLGDARAPAFLETAGARVGLVSMTTAFPPWSRAGATHSRVGGRPGVNPLGYHRRVDEERYETVKEAAMAMGFDVLETEDRELSIHPPGLGNTFYRIVEAEDDRTTLAVNEADAEANLRAIRDATTVTDLVIAHVHAHAWHPEGDVSDPAPFLPEFARKCVDAGADVVIAEGSHSPLRGIELYEDRPIFYDPGDLFLMSDTVSRLPAEFYDRVEHLLDVHPSEAMPAEALLARGSLVGAGTSTGDEEDDEYGFGGAIRSPPGGVFTPVHGNLVPVCRFDDDLELSRVDLHPGVWLSEPAVALGVPVSAPDDDAREIIEHVDDLSSAFGTTVEFEDGTGKIYVD